MGRYAVVQVGSHQYHAQENSVLEVEKLAPETLTKSEGGDIKLDQVLFHHDNGQSKIGQPFVPNTSVMCDVLGNVKLPKVISFKFKRRKGYKRKKGHRQTVVRLRVKSIQSE